ncbi:sensor histidine kinase [Allonocardiopsis opalescens]|uniref:histidine kinase n=1 Tax=Allonocardiopsis opalescens TaxID=1144618 RepID=A0A2T0PX13_9ACTN|nr:nitrate- and nitrite sensing domain-containing protein [Allonocardiopsis opalescens]PRX96080.1 signal transduction histidine kinase [Allonocardiopsis opalescens]
MKTRRRRSIRSRLIALVLVPSTALVLLWSFVMGTSLNTALNLLAMDALVSQATVPAQDVMSQLQLERATTARYFGARAAGHDPAEDAMLATRAATDDAIEIWRQAYASVDFDRAPEHFERRMRDFDTALDGLDQHREALDTGSPTRVQTMGYFNEIGERVLRILDAQTALPDPDMAYQAGNLVTLVRARELIDQEGALLAWVFASGRLTTEDHAEFSRLVGAQRYVYSRITSELPETQYQEYVAVTETDAFRTIRELENEIIGSRAGDALPVASMTWDTSREALDAQLRALEDSWLEVISGTSLRYAGSLIQQIALGTAAGLLLVGGSIVFSTRVTRRLIGRLSGLREATLRLAEERLPSVVARLRRGEDIDVDAEAPELPHDDDEIGAVAGAFNAAQRTAVEAAVDQARLRESVRSVFLNLAHRTQALVHRQLKLLDGMQRRERSPDELEELFQVDHLATRMRRNAENLIVLGGALPGRRWRSPIALRDVSRAAATEIESYARVSLLPMPQVALIGPAVADSIHLLAELLENATAFSPPHTPVQVRGESVAEGFALAIEDRGIGMDDDKLAAANELLTRPPEFDVIGVTEESRLGLFVVAMLAHRHGIAVTLNRSPYGGTQATVLFPSELLTEPAEGPGGTGPLPTRRRRAAGGAPSDGSNVAVLPSRRPASAPRPARPAPQEGAAGSGAAPDSEYRGLPRRRRQNGLAPRPGARHRAPEGGDAPAPSAPERSPEEMRRRLSAYQRGTLRGREEEPGSAPPPGPGAESGRVPDTNDT